MSAILLAVIGLLGFLTGYQVYSRFISEKVFKLDPEFRTPSHEFEDGVDYVPTNKFVLWGHHFTSVAGAAPIVGPAIAVVWGWLPAFLWVVLGTIFFAGVHDAGALWASSRNKAKSIGALAEDIIGPRGRSVFMIVIFLLLLMVNAVFAIVIANLFLSTPSSVFAAWAVIPIAVTIGFLVYRRGVGLGIPSVVGIVLLYLAMWGGQYMPVVLPESVVGLGAASVWVLLLFVYAAVASILPVWVLLQPRDYINGLQLFVALAVVYAAVLIGNPQVVAPAWNGAAASEWGAPSLIPLLFVTIACGAISGFHGLVSSGTTSKQLNKETDVRFVGFLGATGEGTLALAAIIAATAGFASLADWSAFYSAGFPADGTTAFVQGGAQIVNQGLGLPVLFSQTLLAVMAVLFAATTMDTGVRLQRYIIQEWGEIYNIPALKGRLVATLVAVGSCIALAFGAGGGGGSGGLIIWPLFGTTNQLLAGLTLLIISILLLQRKRAIRYTVVPLAFILVAATWALIIQLRGFYESGQYFLMVLDVLILGATIMVALEAISALQRTRRGGGPPAPTTKEPSPAETARSS
ncbi:MAG: carbon starvation protein A [Gemmatimonas sp.]|nr:carbon starvation protein A [Gemmatimonas sp.]